MFPAKACLVPLLILAAVHPTAAQVHETEEPVDLARALVLKADALAPGHLPADPALTQVGAKDFAFSMRLPAPTPLRETVLAVQGDDSQGWRFLLTADGGLRFEARSKGKAEPFAVTTAPRVVGPGTTHHFAINILRDPAKPNSGIWLDGVELASGIVPPADLTSSQPLVAAPGAERIRLYQRSLSRPELLALWLDAADRGNSVAKHPKPPGDGPSFVPQQDETIALIGGTEAVALAESGKLEALLLMAFPQTRFHFRNLAWEGDTVFRQDRPLNFGDLEQQLQRVNAGSVFVMFGRQECLDAATARASDLSDFLAAYNKLLDSIGTITPNIVVVSPAMVHASPTGLNEKMAKAAMTKIEACTAGLKRLAEARGCVFVDATRSGTADGPPRVRDGVTLTEAGIDDIVLSFQADFALPSSITSMFGTAATNFLVREVNSKNRLWHDYWRPANWAFLHGDRTQQPSSRDPVNPQLRFFPAEQENYLPLIKEAEEKVYKLVDEATKKLP